MELQDRLTEGVGTDPTAIVIREETFDQFWTDAQELLEQNYRELSPYIGDRDIPLSADKALYRTLGESGRLCIVAARVEHVIVGYAVFIMTPHPHYSTSTHAQQDVVYLAPTMRRHGLGTRLLLFAERVLHDKGCDVVHHHVKVAHPALGALLGSHGYALIEHVYSKRLRQKVD